MDSFLRNRWSVSSGISGRFPPESVVGFLRNTQVVQNALLGPSGLLGQVIIQRGAYYNAHLPHGDNPLTPGAALPTSHHGYQGLVVLGGEMDAWNDNDYPALGRIMALIRDFHRADKPVLGICLGAQLLARAFGARVYRHRAPEIGFTPLRILEAGWSDPLLGGLGKQVSLMQWHYDTFDLPTGAELLMDGAHCLHQGFRLRRSYGFQCHFEATLDIIREWLRASHHRLARDHPQVLDTLEGQCREHLSAAQHFGTQVMNRWLDQALGNGVHGYPERQT